MWSLPIDQKPQLTWTVARTWEELQWVGMGTSTILILAIQSGMYRLAQCATRFLCPLLSSLASFCIQKHIRSFLDVNHLMPSGVYLIESPPSGSHSGSPVVWLTSSQCSPDSMQNPSQYLLYLSYPFICPAFLPTLCWDPGGQVWLPLAKFSVQIVALSTQLVSSKCLHKNEWMLESKKGETKWGGREGSREEKSRSFKTSVVINWSFDHFMEHFKILKFCLFHSLDLKGSALILK